jgi:photosystem II oxygen-evolving enhancer protein 2
MVKRFLAIALVILSLTLQGCVAGVAGLKNYVDDIDGYEFLYPNGWVPIKTSNGPDVVLRDLIEESDLLSVVISDLTGNSKTLADLGTPSEVGQRLVEKVFAPSGVYDAVTLISAEARTQGERTLYNFEYSVSLPSGDRHNLASVGVSRGKVFTLSISAPEDHWSKQAATFQQVVNSFKVF